MERLIAPVKQIRAAMFKLAGQDQDISVDDIVRELQQTNHFRDSPGLRARIQEQCDAAWSIEAHARRIAAGTEKMLTIPKRLKHRARKPATPRKGRG
jgi:hypothetical protein